MTSPLSPTTLETISLQIYAGVKYSKLFTHNTWAHCLVIQKDAVTFGVTEAGRKTVSQVQRETGANIVINGSDYYPSGRSKGLHWVNGKFRSMQIAWQPFVNFTRENETQILPSTKWTKGYNSLSGKRYIVVDGKVSTRTSGAWYERHPRTLIGVGRNGETIISVIDGRQDNGMTGETKGVTLFEGAAIMVSLGAVTAIDLDGGGSSAMFACDTILNSPIDEGIVGKERAVGNHIIMFVKNTAPPVELPPVVVIETPSGGENEYVVKAEVRPRAIPSMYDNSKKANVPAGFAFTSSRLVTIHDPARVDDEVTFVQMPDSDWLPMFYSDTIYVQEVDTDVVSGYPFIATLKHRFEVDGKSILEHAGYSLWTPGMNVKDIGVPSVIRAKTPTQADFCPMTKEWQLFSLDLIKMWVREKKPAYNDATVDYEARKIFRVAYRGKAFQTNKRGTETNRNYVNNLNMSADLIGVQPVFTGGNVVSVLGEAKRITGDLCYPVRCFNGSLLPPDPNVINWKTHPELIMRATIETRITAANGGREIRPFEFRGVSGFPFFVIVKNSDVAWIKVDRII